MKKYCFFPTGNEVWLNVAIELYKNKIAKPVFWLGDDIHLQKARKFLERVFLLEMILFIINLILFQINMMDNLLSFLNHLIF